MINIIDEVKRLGYGLLYITLLIFIIHYFHLGKWGVIGVLCMSNLFLMGYTSYKQSTPFSFKDLIKNIIQIIVIVHIIRFAGSFGAIGYIGVIIIIVAYILIKKWKQYIEVKQHIETMIWGKPLKEFVKEGKKPPKLEIEWGKNDRSM